MYVDGGISPGTLVDAGDEIGRAGMNARDLALAELDARRLPGWPSDLVCERRDQNSHIDPRDRALAEHIVAATIKNLFLLQFLTTHYSHRPAEAIDPLVRKILAIGLCQLRFLDRIPPAAAVDEAVEQARRFGRAKASGLVNAVLRNALREEAPALPRAEDNPVGYARIVLSHPPELFNRLAALRGVQAALEFCRHDNAEPPTIVRLFAGVEAESLQEDGVTIRPHRSAGMFVVEGAKRDLLARWSRSGLAQVQDPTSAAVLGRMNIEAGQKVLDRCCGMGTKTLQMAELVGEAGLVVAVDPSPVRCQKLREMLGQRGIGNVRVFQTGTLSEAGAELPREFDRILTDVPCSNSGVLARRPEARFSQTESALKSLGELQDRILLDTADWLAPGGLLVYSTCSVWPVENEDRVAMLTSRRMNLVKVEDAITLPESSGDAAEYHDGGYWAVLRRAQVEAQQG
jgi:16S rRNA (cytosine967-C5)-methyltransferase